VTYKGYPSEEGNLNLYGQKYKITSAEEKKPASLPVSIKLDAPTRTRRQGFGYINPEADVNDPSTEIHNGVKYTITDYKNIGKLPDPETKDGVKYINPENKSLFDTYNKDRLQLESLKNTVFNKGKDIKIGDNDWDKQYEVGAYELEGGQLKPGIKTKYSGKELTKLVEQKSNEFVQVVKADAKAVAPKLVTWYESLYKSNKNKDPRTMGEFVADFLDNFNSGKFRKRIKIVTKQGTEYKEDPGAIELNYFRELCRAIYGAYPSGFEKYKQLIDDTAVITEEPVEED
jgi:hypothetical protein